MEGGQGTSRRALAGGRGASNMARAVGVMVLLRSVLLAGALGRFFRVAVLARELNEGA